MKYAIIGAGPIGAGLGACLALAGEEVWLVDPDKAHIDSIREKGLHFTLCNNCGPDQEEIVNLHAVTSAENVGIADIVVLSTKGVFTRSAIKNIQMVSDSHTVIITNQNGLGNLDILKEFFPAEQLAYTVVKYGGRRTGIGKVYMIASAGKCNLPITSENPDLKPILEKMAEALSRRNFTMTVYSKADLDRILWSKLTTNCALNATCALSNCTMDGLFCCQEGVDLAQQIVRENCAVANALGIPLQPEEIEDVETSVQPKKQDGYRHFPSMVADLQGRRKTENPFLNRAVARLGKSLGIPTPYNDAVSALIEVAEQNYDYPL